MITKHRSVTVGIANFIPIILCVAAGFLFREAFILFPILQIVILVVNLCLARTRLEYGAFAACFSGATALYLISNALIYRSCNLSNSIIILLGYELTWLLVIPWAIAIVAVFIFKKFE